MVVPSDAGRSPPLPWLRYAGPACAGPGCPLRRRAVASAPLASLRGARMRGPWLSPQTPGGRLRSLGFATRGPHARALVVPSDAGRSPPLPWLRYAGPACAGPGCPLRRRAVASAPLASLRGARMRGPWLSPQTPGGRLRSLGFATRGPHARALVVPSDAGRSPPLPWLRYAGPAFAGPMRNAGRQARPQGFNPRPRTGVSWASPLVVPSDAGRSPPLPWLRYAGPAFAGPGCPLRRRAVASAPLASLRGARMRGPWLSPQTPGGRLRSLGFATRGPHARALVVPSDAGRSPPLPWLRYAGPACAGPGCPLRRRAVASAPLASLRGARIRGPWLSPQTPGGRLRSLGFATRGPHSRALVVPSDAGRGSPGLRPWLSPQTPGGRLRSLGFATRGPHARALVVPSDAGRSPPLPWLRYAGPACAGPGCPLRRRAVASAPLASLRGARMRGPWLSPQTPGGRLRSLGFATRGPHARALVVPSDAGRSPPLPWLRYAGPACAGPGCPLRRRAVASAPLASLRGARMRRPYAQCRPPSTTARFQSTPPHGTPVDREPLQFLRVLGVVSRTDCRFVPFDTAPSYSRFVLSVESCP